MTNNTISDSKTLQEKHSKMKKKTKDDEKTKKYIEHLRMTIKMSSKIIEIPSVLDGYSDRA